MNDDDLARIAQSQPPFGRYMGVRIVSADRDRVVAEAVVTGDLGNRNGVMHGGAIMAIADNVGGTATFLNLAEGQNTTTLESKTNFFRAIPIDSTLQIVCVPIHRGRRTQVWQTSLSREDGKLAAIVTQTQMIL